MAAGNGERSTVVRGREVAAYIPTVVAGTVDMGTVPVLVSRLTGVSIAMQFTA